MGNGTKNLIRGMITLLGVIIMIASAGLTAPQGFSALSQQPEYASARILIKLKPGKKLSDINGFLSRYNARLGRNVTDQTYTVQLPNSVTPQQILDKKSTLVAKYSAISDIKYDYRVYPMAVTTPDDTYYPDQWNLQPYGHIYAPEAWEFYNTIPKTEVVVAVIDTGIRDRIATDPDDSSVIVRVPHPDLYPHLLAGQGYDYGEYDSDPSPTEFSGTDEGGWGHGTHVAGIIAAQMNNAKGVAGVAPSNVWILPVKVADYKGNMYTSSIISALGFCKSASLTSPATGKTLKVNVINLSLGNYIEDSEFHQAIKDCVNKGIVVVAAAGNDAESGMGISYPAKYDEVIAVGATDETDSVASFSCRGQELDIVAPGVSIPSTVWQPWLATFKFPDKDDGGSGGGGGGNPPAPPGILAMNPGQYVGADIYGNAYVSWPGTSMASPHVAAAAAMLISAGVPSTDVASVLRENATPLGGSIPSNESGYGLLNMYKSLKNSTISVKIQSPGNDSTVSLLRPKFRIDFRRAVQNTIRVWIDNKLVIGPSGENPEIPDWTKYYTIYDQAANKATLVFDYTLDASIQVHKVVSSATSEIIPPAPLKPQVGQDSVRFTVNRSALTKGWHLFSIPYWFDTPMKPENVIKIYNGSLYRWNYANTMYGEYAKYQWGGTNPVKNPEASFAPPSLWENNGIMNPIGWGSITAPAGLGYWLYVNDDNGAPVPDTVGVRLDSTPYQIELHKGWNMVGNPFPFPVSWSTIMIEYNGERLPASEAAKKGWIVDIVYRWDSSLNNGSGEYIRRTSSTAVMVPWEAQWIKVRLNGAAGWPVPDMKLIVPPNPYTGIIP